MLMENGVACEVIRVIIVQIKMHDGLMRMLISIRHV